MKTTNYLFVALGAAALTLTACNNDDDVLNGGQEPGVVNIVTSINGPQTRGRLGQLRGHQRQAEARRLRQWQCRLSGGLHRGHHRPLLGRCRSRSGHRPLHLWRLVYQNRFAGNADLVQRGHSFRPRLALGCTCDKCVKGRDGQPQLQARHAQVGGESDIRQTGIVTPGEATDTDGDYAAQTLTSNSCSFILAPQKLTKGAEWLQFSIPDVATLVYKVPANYQNASGTSTALTELSSGQILTLNMKIKRDSATQKTEVELTTGHISAWGTQGSINDELTIPAN